MPYISKVKLQDTTYEITADKNSEKKTLATEEYTNEQVAQKSQVQIITWGADD